MNTGNQTPESRINEICDRFEGQWQTGNPPLLADFVGGDDKSLGTPLMEALLKLDIHYRQKNGIEVSPLIYTALGPDAVGVAKKILGNVDAYETIPPDSDAALAANQVNDHETGNSTFPPQINASKSQYIGPYKLLQRVGEGGMGTVWMAEQEKPVRRRVALKLIKGAMVDKQIIARFEAERQALAMMDHPNIAKVLDAGTTETGNPYFVMELVNGIPINEYCDGNRLNPNDRLKLFVPVCKAIQHAHQKGIIHRDLKPSNVLVQIHDGQPVAKVIDFGLAKALQHQTKLTDKTMFTEFGQVVGTLQYMSPEQAKMDALNVDTRSDIYSLGVMLYELLAGSTPMDTETLNNNALLHVLELIREKEPPKPSHRLSSSGEKIQAISDLRQIQPSKLQQILRGELDWIVMKALEKDRTRRYETANDFAEDINRYLNGEVVEARPPSTAYKVQKFAQKNRGLVTSLATIAALLVAAVGVTSWFAVEANNARENSDQKAIEVSKERDRANENENLAKSAAKRATDEAKAAAAAETKALSALEQTEATLARSNYLLSNARFKEHRVAEAMSLLHRVPAKYRNFEWYLDRRIYEGSDITLHGHSGIVTSVAFSPDGAWLASGSSDNTIKLWDARSGKEIRTFIGHQKIVYSVAFSPGGKLLASGSVDGTVNIWDVNSGRELRTLTLHQFVMTVAFSPDGTQLATGSRDGTIKIWDVDSGREILTLNEEIWVSSVMFSPDGTQLVSGSDYGPIGSFNLWNTRTGKQILTVTGHQRAAQSVVFSPSGTHIASGSADNTIKLWDARSGVEIRTFSGHEASVKKIIFSPDGKQLASGSEDSTIKLWDAESGEETRTLIGHQNDVMSIAFSPDGTRLASGSKDNTIKLWDARNIEKLQTKTDHQSNGGFLMQMLEDKVHGNFKRNYSNLKRSHSSGLIEFPTRSGHQDRVMGIDFSSDGTRLASASNDRIKVWNAYSGEEIHTIKRRHTSFESVEFSRYGTQLVSTESSSSRINFWNASSGLLIHTLSLPEVSVRSSDFDFSPDGTLFVTSSQKFGQPSDVKLFALRTRKEIRSFTDEHKLEVECVAFSPDGTKLATGGSEFNQTDHSRGLVKLWDSHSGENIFTLTEVDGPVTCVAFSSDGTQIASGSYHGIKLWNVQSGQNICTFNEHNSLVKCLAFSPDGTRIASAGLNEKSIKLWDTSSGEEIRTLNGHQLDVNSIMFSPDGKRLASAGGDHLHKGGEIKLWDARNDCETRTLTGHDNVVTGVAFTQDGQRLSSIDDKNVRIAWDVESGHRVTESDKMDEFKHFNRSPDGRWLALADMETVTLVDLEYKNRPAEKANREYLFRHDPYWHQSQARIAEQANDWYAAAFHRAWLLKINPDNAKTHDYLHDAYQHWLTDQRSELVSQPDVSLANDSKASGHTQQPKTDPEMKLARIVREMLALPRGTRFTAFDAYTTDNLVWNKVKLLSDSSSKTISDTEVNDLRHVVGQFKVSFYFSTLGVAEYRLGNFQPAINNCMKSKELTPVERPQLDATPIDLAILAMSHHELGESDEANNYREQFETAMKTEYFENDEDCKTFAAEVEQLFSAPLSEPVNKK